jgi:hypothetical protein
MPTPPISIVGIPWYLPQTYGRIVEIMADGSSFPKTHGSWRQKAMRMEREIKRQGTKPVRVVVDPEGFLRWCTARSLAADSAARKRFVEETLADQPAGTA